jgi:hypothetical protein
MGRPLWRRYGSAVYSCCWPSPAQSYLPSVKCQPFCFMSLNTVSFIAIILSTSDTAPLSSVMICLFIVATTVNKSFRDELFALGVWTNWLGTCWWLCLKGGVHSFLPLWQGRPVQLRAAEVAAVAVCCCVTPSRTALGGVAGIERLPVEVLDALCDFLFHTSSLASLQPQQLEGWGSSPSTNLQLQHVSIEAALPFSGHSLCRWPHSHHIQRGGCLHLALTWSNFGSCNTAWDKSGLWTPVPWLQYGKGSSFWISHATLTS